MASAVSTQVSRGDTTDLRVACKASIPRPAHHQNKIPAKGQLKALHSSGSIPLGVHSLLSGLATMYGNSATRTGKLSSTGTRICRKSILAALSAVRCCSCVIGGGAIRGIHSDSPIAFAEVCDSMARDISKIKKPRIGHRARRQTESWKIGSVHRNGHKR